MPVDGPHGVSGARAHTFEVICAGEALVNVDGARHVAKSDRLRVRPGGGAINAAIALAQQGLHVGLATTLTDDALGRTLLAKVAQSGVDIDGVELSRRSEGLVLVQGRARYIVSSRADERPITVPAHWSSQVLLLSGLSPVVSQVGALCKAARAARRAGTVVVVDVNAQWNAWQGHDARMIRMVLREADVVWCDAHDLFGLGADLESLRAAMRPNAVLVSSDGVSRASAAGPFGEVTRTRERGDALVPTGEGAAFATAICTELARVGHRDGGSEALWTRTLQRAHALVAQHATR